jgi:hypothetical protein
VSAFCIDQLRSVYDKVYAHFATADIMKTCEEKVIDRYAKPAAAKDNTKPGEENINNAPAEGEGVKFSLASNRTEGGQGVKI